MIGLFQKQCPLTYWLSSIIEFFTTIALQMKSVAKQQANKKRQKANDRCFSERDHRLTK